MAKMGEHGGEEAVTLPRGCNGLPTGVPIRELTCRTHSLDDRVHPREAGCKEKMEAWVTRQYRAGVRQQAYRGKPGRPAKAAW